MPFTTIRGLIGKVYIPETAESQTKKHPCEDCFACQKCSDDRCRVCRNPCDHPGKSGANPKLK